MSYNLFLYITIFTQILSFIILYTSKDLKWRFALRPLGRHFKSLLISDPWRITPFNISNANYSSNNINAIAE